MEKVTVREYCANDIAALTELWRGVFGDSAALIARFFELLPEMGTGFVAECGGETVGMVYALDCAVNGEGCAYLYALAVKEAYRGNGIGSLLTRKVCAEFVSVCTLPSELSLYAFYARSMGVAAVSQVSTRRLYASPLSAEIYEIDASEYGIRREWELRDTKHASFPDALYEFQLALCREYGGGMYACGRSCALGYFENGALLIKECIGDDGFISGLCCRLGAEYALVRSSAREGEPFVAANFELPEAFSFGLSLD